MRVALQNLTNHQLWCRLGKRRLGRSVDTRRCAKTPGCRVFGPDLGEVVMRPLWETSSVL